jgi:hypothetical protein
MTITLLNTTPVVEKLVGKLAERRGDRLVEEGRGDGKKADVAIVDDSVAGEYDAQRAAALGEYTVFIGSRFDEMPEGFDATLGKPFLPDELDRTLDEAELALAADVGRADMFDADEAAEALEEEADFPAAGVFDEEEIDEVKQLLDAVEEEADVLLEGIEGADSHTIEKRIEAALETMDEEELERPFEEVLYEAGAKEEPAPKGDEERFEGIDLHARGVEALQDLMAILSDESVARALKEMGVRIDISFGEKA